MKLLCFAVLCFSVIHVHAQREVFVYDNFVNKDSLIDVSLTVSSWGPYTEPTSAFELVPGKCDKNSLCYDAIKVTDTAIVYADYADPDGLRTATCFDYRFPYILSRANDTIWVEFDAYWDELDSEGGGHTNRIVCAIMHDYPEEGIIMDAIDSVDMEAPFGRPAYNFRVLSRKAIGQNGNIFYGGGTDVDGEFEKYKTDTTWQYWIPGFISAPGGVSPESRDPDYPVTGTMRTRDVQSSDQHWMRYTMKIYHNRVEWIKRKSYEDASANELIRFIETPEVSDDTLAMLEQMNTAHGSYNVNCDCDTLAYQLPPYYNYFDHFRSIRLYARGSGVYFANVTVKATEGAVVADVSDDLLKDGVVNNKIKLFPNPVHQYLTITGEKPLERAEIIDMKGRVVEIVMLHNKTSATIDVSGLDKGIYAIRISSQVLRFIRE